jgi:hypothetical protein
MQERQPSAAFFCERGEIFNVKMLVEKLERFVKFKPQTPLREIIQLMAG